MEFAGLDQTTICLYCQTYGKIYMNYPLNAATFRVDSEVPRCQLHSQYRCDTCKKAIHFNGISWCGDCRKFSCLHCGGAEVVKKEFLVYDYYYAIGCTGCEKKLPALDYVEVIGSHPYQIGDIRPKEVLQLWLPLGQHVLYQPELKAWGNKKLWDMTIDRVFEPVEEREEHSTEIWNANAEFWKESTRNVDINHPLIIIPKMLEFMDPTAIDVMDVACGEGSFTRKLSEAGYTVTGTDISRLLDYAEETERELHQGITYQKIGIHHLKEYYPENRFDQITCNMALMDIDNLPLVLENIRYLLKAGGQFVFSISHPVTAWPVVKTTRLPRDSHHNEDKGWVLDNYVKEQPMLIHMPDMPAPMLYYPRTISTYLNSLADAGFIITRLSEPVPNEDIIMHHPRDMYQTYDRTPSFMIFQTRLIE